MRARAARTAARTMRVGFPLDLSRMSRLVIHRATVQGAVVAIETAVGSDVARGGVLLRLESMKMEFPVEADSDGVVRALHVKVGDAVEIGDALVDVMPGTIRAGAAEPAATPKPATGPSPALLARRALLADAARPDMVAARHAQGRRTARENIAALFDDGSFVEYGAFAVAAQRSRRALEDLQRQTPADGLITGVGLVDAAAFGEERARCAAMAYDYSVLAGTQGAFNHMKSDRLLERAAAHRLPFVLFAEGGGGRPGDVDWPVVAGLDVTTFHRLAALSGVVPRIGIVEGYCFAGNAALLGSCDLVIATRGSSIGMGGPAMIEGGGLGVVAPGDVGPATTLAQAGAIDVLVEDEQQAVALTRRLLGWYRGALPDVGAADQTTLRDAIPAGRQAVFDPRAIVRTLADHDSTKVLRRLVEQTPG